ncbi:hypothetical protein B0J13DRAFT_542876 [Dactylonectria estremocensis]|uniref:Secreted protein n=1 Tax=Dactylonectria estremocensis TaxID=1079267 RepID=A0A9P9FD84_9HYPO|nr:hypothetical protein B0J13DRAFT_542876 [Dactylonectria estremocensis]
MSLGPRIVVCWCACCLLLAVGCACWVRSAGHPFRMLPTSKYPPNACLGIRGPPTCVNVNASQTLLPPLDFVLAASM